MSGGLEGGFLSDIVANVDDDTPRLVFADWLEENAQPERAEFIRVQVQRARLPAWDAAQVRLRLREQEMLEAHGEAWLAAMPKIKGVRWEGFRRGIVAEVSFASFEGMRANAPAARAAAPIEAVTVRWPRLSHAEADDRPIAELRELTLRGRPSPIDFGEAIVEDLAGSPQLATVRVLTLPHLSINWLSLLTRSKHLGNLKVLRLPSNILGNRGVRELTRARSLTGLEELDLSSPDANDLYFGDPIIHAAGMRSLAGWAGLAGVRHLRMDGSAVGHDGLRALLQSPHAAALTSLSLRGNRLTGAAMEEFASAVEGMRLESLDLGQNVLRDAGVAHLASAPCLRGLRELRLDGCEISADGARALAKARFFKGLRRLEVGHNRLGPAGLEALLKKMPPGLHTLGLRDDDLFDKGVVALAGSAASDALLDLDLGHNGLGAAAALALGESPHLRSLLILRLAGNQITEQAAATLAGSPLGKRLAVLGLED